MVTSCLNNAVDKADEVLHYCPSPITFKTHQTSPPRTPLPLLLFSSSPPPSPTLFPPQPLSLLQDFAVQTRNRCLPGPRWKTPLFWMPATCFSLRDEGSQLAFLWSQFQKNKKTKRKKEKEGVEKKTLQMPLSPFKRSTYMSTPFCLLSTVYGCNRDVFFIGYVCIRETKTRCYWWEHFCKLSL